jgi:2-keto-myo-inositol isomerase
MKVDRLSRRRLLAASGATLGAALIAGGRAEAAASPDAAPFKYSLNASTIRGQKVGLAKEIDIAAQAGYSAFEPWIQTIQEYVRAGGKLVDIRKQVEDRGLTVEGAISFPQWSNAKWTCWRRSGANASRLHRPAPTATTLPISI